MTFQKRAFAHDLYFSSIRVICLIWCALQVFLQAVKLDKNCLNMNAVEPYPHYPRGSLLNARTVCKDLKVRRRQEFRSVRFWVFTAVLTILLLKLRSESKASIFVLRTPK